LSRFELLQEVQVRENHILEEFDSEKLGKVRMPRPAATTTAGAAGPPVVRNSISRAGDGWSNSVLLLIHQE